VDVSKVLTGKPYAEMIKPAMRDDGIRPRYSMGACRPSHRRGLPSEARAGSLASFSLSIHTLFQLLEPVLDDDHAD
jgi:hypothetical protein